MKLKRSPPTTLKTAPGPRWKGVKGIYRTVAVLPKVALKADGVKGNGG